MEFVLTKVLLEAHQAGKIPADSDLSELIKLEKAHKAQASTHFILGLTVVPLVTHVLLERLKDPPRQRRYFYLTGLFYYVALWPVRPPAIKEKLRMLGPRYRDVILEGKPEATAQYLSRAIQSVESSGKERPAPQSVRPAEPLPAVVEVRTEASSYSPRAWELSSYSPSQAWEPSSPAKEAELSPYLSPDYAEKPYVYGSLSSSFQSSNKH